ncbi:MAG TPA: PAS domain S-box protein [Nannocystis sp.]
MSDGSDVTSAWLAERPDRRQHLLDAAPDATIVCDAEGLIVFANRQTERLFGYRPAELLGQTVEVLVPARLRAGHMKFRGTYAHAPRSRPMGSGLDLVGVRKDGSEFPVEISLSPFREDGRMLIAAIVRDITERRKVEMAASRLAALVDSSDDAIISTTLDGTITSWNGAAERLFGHRAEEMIGATLAPLLPPERANEEAELRAQLLAGARLEHFETVRLRKGGQRIVVSETISPIRDRTGAIVGVSKVTRDISARKASEAAARLASDRLFDAIESIDDAFAIFDGERKLVMHNSAYRMLFAGLIEGSLLGRTPDELLEAWATARGLGGAERAAFLADHLARFAAERAVDEYELGGRVYQVTIRRTREGGAVTLIVDRTEDRQREQALREASAAKSEFLSSMSHELRTPLNAVLGFAQLLQRDRRQPLTDRQLARVEHIVRGGEHLLHLIDEILDLARIEAGKVPVSIEPLELAGILEHVVTTLGPMAARAEIELEMPDKLEGLPPVLADRTRYAQVLMNFGSNAIKYGRRGGKVKFAVTTPAPERVRVSVIDDGIGIAPEHQGKLFQPFYRAGQETGPIEGTGIGLALSKQLAELMHGTVGFTSTLGEGSEFWIELPAAAPAAATEVVPTVPAPASLTGEGSTFVVVYIEDHPANIAFMEELLADFARIELITAPTAEIGLELVRTRKPDVVILDINLPGMSGLDAIRQLRAWPETRDIPVIGLSAAAMPRDTQRALAAGFHRYLTKPIKVDELVEVLEELLVRPQAASG